MLTSTKVIEDPAVVEALAELSSSAKVDTRAMCAASLGFTHVAEERAVQALEALVRDPEERVRLLAAKSISLLAARSPAAVNALCWRVLASADVDLVRAAFEVLTLGQCLHPQLAEALGSLALCRRLVPLESVPQPKPEPKPRPKPGFFQRLFSGKGEQTPPVDTPPVEPPSVWDWPEAWSRGIANSACQVLGLFPAHLSMPHLVKVLQKYRKDDERSMRELAINGLFTQTPGGGEARDAILETIIHCGTRKPGDGTNPAHCSDTSHTDSGRYLRRLLEGPVSPEVLIRTLAGVLRPPVSAFAPRMRELLAGAPLSPEALEAVHRGFASEDPLVRANAASWLSCSLAQARQEEGRLVACLQDPEATVRKRAANVLGMIDAVAPETLAALTRVAREHPRGADGRSAREALARHGAPVPLPPGGVDVRAAVQAVLPVPFHISPDALVGADGALYVVWKRVLEAAPEGTWSTDEDEVGMARVRLTPEGPRLDSFPVLAKLPRARTGGNIKRWFRLSAQLGDDFVCRLEQPFSSDLGWGTLNFLLLFNPATQSWSQLVPGQEGLRRVEVDASPEEYERAVGGGELLVWVDAQGKLRTKVDDTPYFMEGSRPPSDVKAAYREERAAGEAARRHHQLEMEDGGETYAQEPWVVRAPADAAFQPVHLYGVRQALFEHHPHLGPEDVEEIRCRGAHRLKGPDGRMSLIFFVDARRHLGDWVQSCLVTRLP